MHQRFLQQLKKHAPIKPTEKLLVAVSGGVDSMVLLDLLLRSGYDCNVAHCNFQLRGASADADEQFVMKYSQENEIPFFTKQFETLAYAADRGISTQMAARDLRYEWFELLIKEYKLDKLVTAHHKDDQVETFLLGMTRGGGLKSLVGMSAKRSHIIRPLLPFTKEEIYDYAKARKIQWREDASNAEDKYKRNFIRQHIKPPLEELNPNYLETVSSMMDRLKAVDEVFEQYKKKLQDQWELDGEQRSIQLETLQKEFKSAYLLSEVFEAYGLNEDQTNALLMLKESDSGQTFTTRTHEVLVNRGAIQFRRIEVAEFSSELIEETDMHMLNGTYSLFVKPFNAHSLDKDSAHAQLDYDRLTFPLSLRTWQQGDRFVPLGMKGSKLVSDFLIDEKISVFEKEQTKVLLSGEEIVWLVGYRISDKFKCTKKTENVLHIVKTKSS